MYKTILVPLDGSRLAETILPYVESLARSYAAKVILTRVVEHHAWGHRPNAFVMSEAEALRGETETAEAYLAVQREKLCDKGIPSRACVIYGRVAETIIKLACREGADLVAMASHGRTGLAHVFYGSVAASVLHQIDRPLLLVRSME